MLEGWAKFGDHQESTLKVDILLTGFLSDKQNYYLLLKYLESAFSLLEFEDPSCWLSFFF